MIIRGTTVGTPSLRPDWKQTDPRKSDYIRNKPDLSPKAGLIYPLASKIVPAGFLLCDGAEYSRTQYSKLFDAIGTTYGEGNGLTTFNVPNLSTRVPVGSGDGYDLGATGGEEKVTLSVEEMPSHNHAIGLTDNKDRGSLYAQSARSYSNEATTGEPYANESSGGGQPHNNMPPYTVVNYIISTGEEVEFVVGDGNPEGTVLYTPQTLTPEQKAQVRSNINAVSYEHICPKFTRDGSLVTCEPLEGAPISIRAVIAEDKTTPTTIWHGGRNLLGREETRLPFAGVTKQQNGVKFTSYSNGGVFVNGTPTKCFVVQIGVITLPAGTYTFSLGGTNKKVYFQLYQYDTNGNKVRNIHDNSCLVGGSLLKQTFTLEETSVLCAKLYCASGQSVSAWAYPMISVGDSYVPYEQYCGKYYTISPEEYSDADAVKPGYEVIRELPALSGVNTVVILPELGQNYDRYDVGCYNDPKKVIEKLTNAIIELGGNI